MAKDGIASASRAFLLLFFLWVALVGTAWATRAQAAQYPISGNVRFQIGDGLPLPITFALAPEGKVHATPNAVVTQTSSGIDPVRMTIPNAVFRHPGTPPVVLPLGPPAFQIKTAVNVTFPTTTLRPGAVLLNVLQANGRTGPPTVTWCPGQPIPTVSYNPACTSAWAAPLTSVPGKLRYRRTANQFGGPISYLVGGLIDLALNPFGATLPCSFLTSSKCRALFTIYPPLQSLAIGEPFGHRALAWNPALNPGQFNIVAITNGIIVGITPTGVGPGTSNWAESWGGPWTTGQLINTAITVLGSEMFTRTGSDSRVHGVGAIHLIAGAVSNRSLTGPTANRGWLNITVPEPAALVSAASALLLLVACHSLVRRRPR